MTRAELISRIKQKRTFLCVGLDTDPARIPDHLRQTGDPVFEFNKNIIDATKDLCIAYKPNIAFYAARGPAGWESLGKTLAYIPEDCFTIADAKCGDIGTSSEKYAETFFKHYDFDAVTVSPYMGQDSVAPFLAYTGKWVILLALTSNRGADDFQKPGPDPLYKKVLAVSSQWGSPGNMMYVAGATQSTLFASVRETVPAHFLLVPGLGVQGGSLETIARTGLTADCGLIVNASRSILYASADTAFAEKARDEAATIQRKMAGLLASLPH